MSHPLMSADLTTSSRFAPDSGEILLKFFENVAETDENQRLKREIAMKRKLIESYQKRADVLRREILKKTPEKMMNLAEINASIPMAIERREPQDLTGYLHAEQLEVFKICHGVTISNRTASTITFQFVGNDNGPLLPDAYEVTLAKSESGKLELLSAVLPKPQSLDPELYPRFPCANKTLVIPIQKLAEEHLSKVDAFIKAVQVHLNAYLSRFDQLASMPEEFPDKLVHDIDYNDDLTAIKFALSIGETTEDDPEGQLTLHVRLQYE